MAVFPNASCLGFCDWMLNVSWQTLTPSRLNLIQSIYTAALNGTSVSDQDYNNFIQVSSWREPYYLTWLSNSTPFSLPPIGTCDIWFSAAYLQKDISNAYGIVSFNNTVTRINSVNGSGYYALNALPARNPYLCVDTSKTFTSKSFAFNQSGVQNFQVQNFGTLTQNITGYTLFVVANNNTLSVNNWAFYFSANTSAGKSRIGLMVNSSNNWTGQAIRLDADVQGTIGGAAASKNMQIICLTVDYSTGIGKMYNNGVLTTTNPALTSMGSTSNTACFAVSVGSLNQGNIWNGLISDCLSFQTALSDADVLTITEWLNSMRRVY